MEFNATFLATIISFIVFVILMNKILYVPVLKIMEQREVYIDENYQTSKKNNEQAKELISKKEESLIVARMDAKEKYNKIVESVKTERANIVLNAQEEMKVKLENSKVELENLSREVKEGLKNSMTCLANDIVEKVIGYRSEVQGFDSKDIDEILYN
ncbi:ATP synthase F0 subunit B [bacterium]|nr:ATP synthase F0 subunit B [bacterium]